MSVTLAARIRDHLYRHARVPMTVLLKTGPTGSRGHLLTVYFTDKHYIADVHNVAEYLELLRLFVVLGYAK